MNLVEYQSVGLFLATTTWQHQRVSPFIVDIPTFFHFLNISASIIQGMMVMKQMKMEGFHVKRYLPKWDDAVELNARWWKEGKLVYRETVTKGFENTFKAFEEMLKGANFGKAIVEV